MGDYISLSEGLLIAVVSIVAVFIVLIIVALLISGLKAFSGEKKEKTLSEAKKIKEVSSTAIIVGADKPIIEEDPNQITEELVAVIAGAIAANLGMNIPDINIKSIRRVPQMTSTWSNVGSMKQTMGRL